MRKLWFDTEFIEYEAVLEDGRKFPVTDPISFAVVDLEGRSFMAVFKEFNRAAAEQNEWVTENVLAKLPDESTWQSRDQIREGLLDFIGEDPTEFRYWYAPQDAVILHKIFAVSFLDQPENVKGSPFNIAQKFQEMAVPSAYIPLNMDKHEVLSDAIWTRDFDLAMDQYLIDIQENSL
ncbi:MAG: hypothetical protein CMH27_02440 [Micavibrio sp.]|nr:hypothetical protein [Micavibrio sp.]|tara:strand:+ start:5493 stop:6026 length:534 start_codon:yes stop_codon:yes gene_type:complete